ncbi:MAG: hypothetical protein OXH04_14040 [Acidobacteria bacterium]|nr:hypothetical protein [Acidobacteriota bacterium]
MDAETMEQRINDLDRRVGRVEQILPTLATKADLLATKAELEAAIAGAIAGAIEPLATRAELHAAIAESEERMRRHFDVVAESLRDDIRLIAEGLGALSERLG